MAGLGLKLAGVLVVLLLALSGCRDATRGRTLSGPEISQLFSGKTVRGYHEKRGYSFESYYEPSGSFRSYQGGAKTPRVGKWWVGNGNDICVRWIDTAEQFCRKMVTDGNGHFRKVLVKHNDVRVLIVTFESFEPGNRKGL